MHFAGCFLPVEHNALAAGRTQETQSFVLKKMVWKLLATARCFF